MLLENVTPHIDSASNFGTYRSQTCAVVMSPCAATAWSTFGEGFASWADWAPGIDRSTLAGPLAQGVVRTNETASLGKVEQELVRFDPDGRALAYEMRTLPPMFTHMRNDWVLEDLTGERCRLVGEAVFEVAEQAEPMREKLEGKMGMTLEVFAKAFRDSVQGG